MNNLITLFILLGYFTGSLSAAIEAAAAEALIILANKEAAGRPAANNNQRRSRAKTVACQYCDHKATSRSAIIIHERTHTGEKPYKCRFDVNTQQQKALMSSLTNELTLARNHMHANSVSTPQHKNLPSSSTSEAILVINHMHANSVTIGQDLNAI